MLGLLIVISLLSMLACALIARARKADWPWWALAGLLLGPVAIPFAMFARAKTSASNADSPPG